MNGTPVFVDPEVEANTLLNQAIHAIARDLQGSIANLGNPVGMGLAPSDEMYIATATKIVERFSGAVLRAVEHERCGDQWRPIAEHDGSEDPVDLWFKEKRWTDFRWSSEGVRGWYREEGYPVTRRVLLGQPTHFRRIPAGPVDTEKPSPTIILPS